MRKKIFTVIRLNKASHFVKKYNKNTLFIVFKIKNTDEARTNLNEPIIEYHNLVSFECLGWDHPKSRFYNNKEYKDNKQIWRM